MSTTYPEEQVLEYDNLLAGPRQHFRVFDVTVAAGQNLTRGTLVAYSGGTVSQVTAASDTPFGIIVSDVDASSAASHGLVYVAGDFNKAAVNVGSLSIDDFVQSARNVGILLREAN